VELFYFYAKYIIIQFNNTYLYSKWHFYLTVKVFQLNPSENIKK